MWCGHCKQDVPAVSAMGGGSTHCARCQRPIVTAGSASTHGQDASHASMAAASESVSIAAPRRVDAEERYRRIGQTLKSAQRRAAPSRPDARLLRIDAAEPQFHTRDPQPLRPITPASAKPPRDPNRGSQIVAWGLSLVGATLLGAGLGLIGWSLLGERADLWNWGLFATLGGQGLLVVGLVLLLANLWSNARTSTGRLVAVQNEILRLQRSTEALTGDRTASATRFYADLARGASPELLVANLRGQLDELNATISAE